MLNHTDNNNLLTLKAKGGVMFFTIIRPGKVYRGLVMLSPVLEGRYNKNVFIKEYRFNPGGGL